MPMWLAERRGRFHYGCPRSNRRGKLVVFDSLITGIPGMVKRNANGAAAAPEAFIEENRHG
jgi:hypothetical protein